jgi:hypothetical protein
VFSDMDPSNRSRFDSWKEIANYLRISVRTVQRWEKDEGLPVHRHTHARQDTIYAYKDEIDAWRSDRDRYTAVADGPPRSTEIASLQAEIHGAAPATPPAASRSLQAPFLRRTDELRILLENLEAVAAGDVRMVCLTGEPGAGKTTLLAHFIAATRAACEPLVTFSTCSQRLAGAEAFLPCSTASTASRTQARTRPSRGSSS